MVARRNQGQELTPQQTINHYITYSIITAQPELSFTSVVSTIRCYSVTSGELEGSTFVEWTGNWSSDAGAGELSFTRPRFIFGYNR